MLPLLPIAIGLAAARARARATHERLGQGVEEMSPLGPCPEELRRARERWLTAGALLAGATTAEECELAARVAAEGLRHLAAAGRTGDRP